jgi:hypothetical protein
MTESESTNLEAVEAVKKLTIVVADGEGDTKDVIENEHGTLKHLLRRGLKELVGDHADPAEYDLLINGTIQENLEETLVKAGLKDGSEVVILSKDVSRG